MDTSLFTDINGIKKLTGKNGQLYVLNIKTNEKLLLAQEITSIEIINCSSEQETKFSYELERGIVNIDVFIVMQRHYDSYGYIPTKTHQFFLNFETIDANGNLRKIQLTGGHPTSQVAVNLLVSQSSIFEKWQGTAKEIIEVV